MPDVPAASFMNFLSGLAAQALMQFGEIPNPMTGERAANPAYARYTVQLLEVLWAKTAGNRTPEEEAYFGQLIADCRRRLEGLASAP